MNFQFPYDFLLVGAGLFNAIFAREATRHGKKCLVIEKRNHAGGNLYCENIEGINVHKYGAHIFHTSNRAVWDYMNELCAFNRYVNSPLARYKDKVYNLPFNMNTFYQLWGTVMPEEAKARIESQRLKIKEPQNVEEQALSLVGKDIYETLIKGYTEKQWGMAATQLPAFIIRRLPLRFTYNNNYFNDLYQGIPEGGYNPVFEKCFKDCDVVLNTDFLQNREWAKEAKTVIFTGRIDQYYDYCFGALEYRSLRFEDEILSTDNYQGNAVVNYTEKEIPFTRIIEHKHFEFGQQAQTVITREYPQAWKSGLEPFYPVNTKENDRRYQQYKELSLQEKNVFFGGRLGCYKYFNMDQVVESAIDLAMILRQAGPQSLASI
jgi:UDP-galactopyranose mutase